MATVKPPKAPKKTTKAGDNPLDALTDDLKNELPALQSKVDRLTDTALDIRREIGEQLIKIIDDDTGKYGSNPEKAIAKVMPLSADSIRPMVAFARNYTRDDVDRLKAMRNPKTSERLTWSHIIALTRVPSKDKAFALAEKAVDQGWGTKEMNREVIKAAGGKKSKGGRKPKVAKSFNDCVADVAAKTASYSNVMGAWMGKDGLSDLFAAATKNGHILSPAEIENVADALAKVDDLGLSLRQLAMQLSALKHQAGAARARAQKLAG